MTSVLPALALSTRSRLAPLDLAIVGLYLVAITLFGLRFSRRAKRTGTPGSSLRTYFLADNTIPWWAIALSIVSAETSTLTIISVPGVAFAGNFGFLQIVIGYMLGRIVVALLFLPRYFRGEMLTAYQLIDQRFGGTLHKVTAGLFLVTRAAAEGVRVFAISIVVGVAIGTGDTLSIAIISGLTLLYTFEGGMAAVIWTDVVQMGLYVVGTLVALWTLGHHASGGWSQIHAVAAPLGKFHMLDFTFSLTKAYTFWAGVLGGTFLTMASHGTDQLMVQRMLAARSLRESRLALLSSGVVIFLQFTLFLLIGVGLFVFYGNHPHAFTSPDRIFPTFIVQEMPRGVAGLLVAAILAAAMSNLSAALNSLASTTVVDFYMELRPQADSRERTVVSRLSTVFWAVVLFAIAVYAIQHGGRGHVVETGLSIASVAYGSLLGVFLLGTLTGYATERATIIGMICGFALNLYLWQGRFPFTVGPLTIPQVAFTWYVLIGALVTFATGSLASLVFRKQSTHRVISSVALLMMVALGTGSLAAQSQAAKTSGGVPTGSRMLLEATHTEAAGKSFDFSPISTLVTQAIDQNRLPGAVVVVGHSGKIVFERAYGLRKIADEPGLDGKPSPAEPMSEDTMFDMASLTKVLVTTTAVMQLYQAHKLELDAPVAKYLSAFAVNGKQNVTIRELLTHYSGLAPDVDLKDSWGLAAPDKAEATRRALGSSLVTVPGTNFGYSDINFIVLGLLVESVSTQTLDAYASEHIFRPLGMATSGFHPFAGTCGPRIEYGSAIEPGPKPLGRIGMACLPGTWSPLSLDRSTAPTAHDNEGTAATNPDFDRLLRGTVHDPTARRMGGVAGHAGVFSTAGDASLFCQALLDKLVHDTGSFPLSQVMLKLMATPQQPATAAGGATIFTAGGQPTKGIAARGFGWDINSAFSRPRGEIFPISTTAKIGSFGHTGFTGTSLWIDPVSDTYVILLSNTIHLRGAASISALRGQVATAAARVLGLDSVTSSQVRAPTALPSDESSFPLQVSEVQAHDVSSDTKSAGARTLTGIDVLEATHFVALHEAAQRHNGHLRLGLLTNQSGLNKEGRRTIDILAGDAHKVFPEIELTTIFSPEHGLQGTHDDFKIGNEIDSVTHLSIISVYGPKAADRRPKKADLSKLDAVVIDLQDAGVHFWTYETLTGYFLEAAAKSHTEIIVLDRPNPIGGDAIQGPVSDVGLESYTNFMPLPVRHGLTLGELARYFNGEATEVQLDPRLLEAGALRIGEEAADRTPPVTQRGLHADLTIVRMQGWSRAKYFDDTHLPWTPPSPNLCTPIAAILYPGVGLVEQTNISVGRGTPAPFENVAAPWIKPLELARYLTERHIAGVGFTPVSVAIAEDENRYPFHGQAVPGIHFTVTGRQVLDSAELGIELLSALHHLYPEFQPGRAKTLVANAATMEALGRDEDPRAIAAAWQPGLATFRVRREPYLLYH